MRCPEGSWWCSEGGGGVLRREGMADVPQRREGRWALWPGYQPSSCTGAVYHVTCMCFIPSTGHAHLPSSSVSPLNLPPYSVHIAISGNLFLTLPTHPQVWGLHAGHPPPSLENSTQYLSMGPPTRCRFLTLSKMSTSSRNTSVFAELPWNRKWKQGEWNKEACARETRAGGSRRALEEFPQ